MVIANCVEVLWPSQPSRVMLTVFDCFSGQA